MRTLTGISGEYMTFEQNDGQNAWRSRNFIGIVQWEDWLFQRVNGLI